MKLLEVTGSLGRSIGPPNMCGALASCGFVLNVALNFESSNCPISKWHLVTVYCTDLLTSLTFIFHTIFGLWEVQKEFLKGLLIQLKRWFLYNFRKISLKIVKWWHFDCFHQEGHSGSMVHCAAGNKSLQ